MGKLTFASPSNEDQLSKLDLRNEGVELSDEDDISEKMMRRVRE